MTKREKRKFILNVLLSLLTIGGIAIYPQYVLYRQKLLDQAEFDRVNHYKYTLVTEAQARQEAGQILRRLQIESADATAKANDLISKSLKKNKEYLAWLYIQTVYNYKKDFPVRDVSLLKKDEERKEDK